MIDKQERSEKIAIFSDLHLGVHGDSSFWLSVADVWTDWFVLELKKANINKIYFLGDFYEMRSDVSVLTLNTGSRILDKLRDFNIKMIPGNHDCFYKLRSDVNSINIANNRNNVRVYNSLTEIKEGEKNILLLPWGANITNLSKRYDYIFGHLEINSFKMNGSKVCEKGISPNDLLKLSSNIYSGHFHQKDTRIYNNGSITYVGNCFETNFGEAGSPKGFHILDLDTGELTFIENTYSPTHKKVLLSSLSTLDKETLKNNIVRVVVNQKIESKEVEKVVKELTGYSPADCTVEYVLPTTNETLPIKLSEGVVNYETSITEFVNQLSLDEITKQPVINKCIEFLKKCKV